MERNTNLPPVSELALNILIRFINCLYWGFIITCKGFYVPFKKQAIYIYLTSLDIKPFSRKTLETLQCRVAPPTNWGPPQCITLQSETRGIIIKALYMKWMKSFIDSLKNKDLLLSTSLVFKEVRINSTLPDNLSKFFELKYLCLNNCTGEKIDLGMLLYRCSKLQNLHLISTNSFDSSLCISPMQPNQEIKQRRLDVLKMLQSNMYDVATLCSLSIDCASTTKIDIDVNNEFWYDLVLTNFKEIIGGQFTAKLYCRFHLRGENRARIVHIKVTGPKYQDLLGLPLGQR